MVKQIAILDAPSNLGLMPPKPGIEPGVRKMPGVLRQYGTVEKINARDAGEALSPPYNFYLDPKIGIRNSSSIRDYTYLLANAVESSIQDQMFPLVLGGDCSILLGSMLALKRRGNYGLIFIDGHRDFQTPETSVTGGAAGMDLALVTGHGPSELTYFDSYDTLIDEKLVAVIGYRDLSEAANDGSSAIYDTKVHLFGLKKVRRLRPEKVAKEVISTIEPHVSGFWIHLDVDVLNSKIMPAADSPEPGGMLYSELDTILRTFLENGKTIGMEITIYDPERDPGQSVGKKLAKWIINLFNKQAKNDGYR